MAKLEGFGGVFLEKINLIFNMKHLLTLGVVLLAACQKPSSDTTRLETYQSPAHHTSSLSNVFNTHGGFEQWSKMKTLSYKKGDEATTTNLQNRMIRLETAERTIGFDGEKVWVAPDTVDASRARFYHNLYFYFYAMPFVVGDPGASYEDLDAKEIAGKSYKGIKVSYGEGVGDAPDDNYIIWYDPETFRMEWLMYTVTYRSGEPSDKYGLIRYDQWAENNKLMLPTSISWYTYEEDSVGALRSEASFENIVISEDTPSASLFAMPENAQVAPR